MIKPSPNFTAPELALERLFWLRNLAIAGQIITILSIQYLLDIPLPASRMWVVSVFLLGFNALTLWRLKQDFPVSALEVAVNLAIDSCAFAILLYFSGGSGNPFVSLFLVPVALAAVFLPLKYALFIAGLTVVLYSMLMVWYVPLPPVNQRFGGDFNLHIFGMWVSYILSAVIMVVFITALVRLARRHDQALAEAREQNLRNEHLVSLGTLAAGAAHEFSTPVSNMGMIADELLENSNDPDLVREDAQTLKQEVENCRQQLTILLGNANGLEGAQAAQPLSEYLTNTINRWKAMRSEIGVAVTADYQVEPLIKVDSTLAQTLLNLFNNAADASLENNRPQVEIHCETNSETLVIEIVDYGKGLTDQQIRLAGKEKFSTKSDGLGLGLVLSHATLARLGGELMLHPHGRADTSGILTRIKLPLNRLSID